MVNFFTVSAVFSFLGCLTIGVLYAWLLYRGNKQLEKRLSYSLSLFRAFAVALICWLLVAPLFKKISYIAEKPILVLAHDNSLSVAQIKPIGFKEEVYQKDMRELAARLSAKYEVRTYSFSDSVRSGLDFSGRGQLSNAAALFTQLNNELLNRNVGAVIMASDGIFNQGGNPLYDLKQLKAPIYTVALGDTIAKRDALIANVNYNNLVYLDNEFTLDVQLQAYQSKGETVQLTVAENGVKIKEERVIINSGSFIANIPIKIKANKIGIQKYDITVSALKNEITTKNNHQTIFVEVIDANQKVLIVAAAPHPDIATLKQAISLNKHYEVTVALPDDFSHIAINNYSLVILYQIPGANEANMSFVHQIQSSKIALWYILGAQSNLNALNQLQKLVYVNGVGTSLQEVFPYAAPNFTLFNIDANALKQLDNYDPLQAPFGKLNVNGSYSAVLNQRIGKINTQSPLLFFMTDNERKVGFLMGEGIWKWKLEEANTAQDGSLLEELVAKTLQYLAVKDDKRKFKVYANKTTFDENEQIILNATLYNEAYEPVNTPDVNVLIKAANGKEFNFRFSKFGTTYRLDAGNLPEGNYTFLATTRLGDKNHTASGAFYINTLITEYQQTRANHQLLYAMAHQSNGKMYQPTELLRIADDLEKSDQLKTITYEDRKYEELINFKWIFIVIILLLSVEWFLRKRNGEI